MSWLIFGMTLWFFVHGFKALFPTTRLKITELKGEDKSKGLFSLGIVASIVLIVFGWRHSDPSILLYQPIDVLFFPSMTLIILSLYLFVASTAPIKMRRWIRHPQLTGLALWSVAHLGVNGELRSVILFGGFLLWSCVLIPCINRRDGAYEPPIPGTVKDEMKPVVITLMVSTLLLLMHGFYTAQPVIRW